MLTKEEIKEQNKGYAAQAGITTAEATGLNPNHLALALVTTMGAEGGFRTAPPRQDGGRSIGAFQGGIDGTPTSILLDPQKASQHYANVFAKRVIALGGDKNPDDPTPYILAALAHQQGDGNVAKHGANFQAYGSNGQRRAQLLTNAFNGFNQVAQTYQGDGTSADPTNPADLQVAAPKTGWTDKFVQAANALGGVGGAAANIIAAMKQTGTTPGNQSLAMAQAQQAADAKAQGETDKRNQLNSFLTNPNVPDAAKLGAGYNAQGTPVSQINDLINPQPSALDLQNNVNKNISARQDANDRRDQAIRIGTFTPAEEKSYYESDQNRLNTEELLQRVESGISPNLFAALATNMDTGSAAYQRIMQGLNPKELETVQIMRDIEQRVQRSVKEASGVQYGFKELNWLKSIMSGKYDTPAMLKLSFKRAIVNSRFNQLIPVIGKIQKVAAYDPNEAVKLMASRGISPDMLDAFETITGKLKGLKSNDDALQISIFSNPKYLPELRLLGLQRILEK